MVALLALPFAEKLFPKRTLAAAVTVWRTVESVAGAGGVDWRLWALRAWGVVAFLLLIRLLVSHVSAWKLAKGLHGIVETGRVLAPITCGLWRPAVLMPRESVSWSAEKLRAVLLHEQAHVARHDILSQLIAQLACCLYWFHPLAWLGLRRMSMEREKACDDLVLLAGVKASDYAECLLSLARDMAGRAIWGPAVVSMASPAPIEARLTAILAPEVKRGTLKSRMVLVIMLIAAALTASLGVVRGHSPQRIRVGGNVIPAKLMHMQKPLHPGAGGKVEVRAVISTTGTLLGVSVLESPSPALTQAAMAALREWRYHPARLNGQPVETVARITLNFGSEK
jgi:TonB family protein